MKNYLLLATTIGIALSIQLTISGCKPAQPQLPSEPTSATSYPPLEPTSAAPTPLPPDPSSRKQSSTSTSATRKRIDPVPRELVGTWNGGPGSASLFYLTIRTDGTYLRKVQTRDHLWQETGTLHFNGSSMTLRSSTGSTIHLSWHLENPGGGIYEVLLLQDSDGGQSSYVRT